jgi:hypothetical protein
MIGGSRSNRGEGPNPGEYEELSMSPKKSTSTSSKKSVGFSAEEKAAAREYIKELKAQARADYDRAAGEKALGEKIAEMPEPDRSMARRFHEIVTATDAASCSPMAAS